MGKICKATGVPRVTAHGMRGLHGTLSLIKRYVEALGGEIHIVATLRGKIVRLPV